MQAPHETPKQIYDLTCRMQDCMIRGGKRTDFVSFALRHNACLAAVRLSVQLQEHSEDVQLLVSRRACDRKDG